MLAENKFDFNKWINDGVGYLRDVRVLYFVFICCISQSDAMSLRESIIAHHQKFHGGQEESNEENGADTKHDGDESKAKVATAPQIPDDMKTRLLPILYVFGEIWFNYIFLFVVKKSKCT
jgi:hypothetical protein